jgi:REP-associated tyrosine transposase
VGRIARTSLPDGFFHVTARGVAQRGNIFRDNADRETFLAFLRQTVRRQSWICQAFCLMGTHYHLVLETQRAALSSGLQRLNWQYALHFNRKYGCLGHLFADRFSSRVIESEEYLFEACAYVLMNPVKAGLCERVDEWPWSYCRTGGGARLP